MGAGSLEAGGRLTYLDNKDESQGFYGSDGTRTRDLRRDRPAFRGPLVPQWWALSYWRTGRSMVGKVFGGTDPWAREAASQAEFRP
jgi:hypothetical protein